MSAVPTRKITSVALAGAATTIAVWASNAFAGVVIPGDVAAAATTILAAVVGYLVPDG